MESINLEKLQELIDLFKKFNIDTLDSIGILLQYTKNLSRETNFAFINVYKDKALEMRNEFEGINEYDYICKVNNFNLSEIERIIDSLNNDELKYLRVLINNAYNNIDKDSFENKILSELKDSLDLINSKLNNELTKKELETLFNKYSLQELNTLSMVFEYVHEYSIDKIKMVLKKVYKEKERDMFWEYSSGDNSTFNQHSIFEKNSLLNNNELNFLYKLVEDSEDFLSYIQSNEYEYEDLEGFDLNNYPISFVQEYQSSLDDEINKRKNDTKQKIKLKLKKSSL